MKNNHLIMQSPWIIKEAEYDLGAEAHVAALFTTGNGYIGVRGSLEEYGSLRIQGAYIRGLIDEIYEIPQPFLDNLYMKKYYFDEDKLRRFEKEESVVNFADFLLLRFSINGETFFPWEGELLSWDRSLDMASGRLLRDVRWKNSKGDITHFQFERFSSFAEDHIYAIRASATPENYEGTIEVLSGVDIMTKTRLYSYKGLYQRQPRVVGKSFGAEIPFCHCYRSRDPFVFRRCRNFACMVPC